MPVRIDLMNPGVLHDVRSLSVVVDIVPHERSDALARFFHTSAVGETVRTRRVIKDHRDWNTFGLPSLRYVGTCGRSLMSMFIGILRPSALGDPLGNAFSGLEGATAGCSASGSCDALTVHLEMPRDILHPIILVADHRQGSCNNWHWTEDHARFPVKANIKETCPFLR